ncbi:MAG: MOFRL family protein, partial [Planctomycetota bacterium]
GSENEGEAAAEGRNIAERAVAIRRGVGLGDRPVCLLSGGEPTVRLAKTDLPQKGGRNQELAVAAAEFLRAHDPSRITLLAGGTDGEDGPTDAAGGFADAAMLAKMTECGLDPREFLAINNTYPLLERADALFRTGPTGTNVMDLRVVLIAP